MAGMNEPSFWARSFDALHDAMVYRRYRDEAPERARFAIVHDRDVPQRVKDFCAEHEADVCFDRNDEVHFIDAPPV
jgi:hypothetical protein